MKALQSPQSLGSLNVLVTGSSGLIGRHLARRLLDCGHTVVGLDLVPADAAHPVAEPIILDICDRERLIRCVQDVRPDAVIHLAARTDLDERRDLNGYAANIEGVRNLIAAVRATPGIRRAVYTSSQLVCRVGHVPQHDREYCPNTLYGRSKVLSEQIVRDGEGGGVPWCLARPTTVWGPFMSPHYQRLLSLIQAGRYFHVGRQPLQKSYAYAGNIAHQYERLCTADDGAIYGKTFYLADYEPITLQAWTDGLAGALGGRPIPTYPRALVRWLARIGDVVNACGGRFPLDSFRLRNILTEYVFDLSATRAVCGPLPYTMQQGLAETAAWFLNREAADAQPPAENEDPPNRRLQSRPNKQAA